MEAEHGDTLDGACIPAGVKGRIRRGVASPSMRKAYATMAKVTTLHLKEGSGLG
jgi:hypothetical protein